MTTVRHTWDLYGGRDPREIPSYNIFDAARYLRIPEQTIRNWCYGRRWNTKAGTREAAPVVQPADPQRHLLSFLNLIELHVLDAIRREHKIELANVRRTVRYLAREFRTQHPLADVQMETNGTDLFVQEYGRLVNASREGQLAMQAVLEGFLRRIDRDPTGLAIRLYPFTRAGKQGEPLISNAPKVIAIEPTVAFGRPVIAGSRIPTVEVAERFKAGESLSSLSRDYGRPTEEIEEAVRCELELDTAA